jgi:hypothetical protein
MKAIMALHVSWTRPRRRGHAIVFKAVTAVSIAAVKGGRWFTAAVDGLPWLSSGRSARRP